MAESDEVNAESCATTNNNNNSTSTHTNNGANNITNGKNYDMEKIVEVVAMATDQQQQQQQLQQKQSPPSMTIDYCEKREMCISMADVLKSFNNPISEEQAWAVLYQFTKLYKTVFVQLQKEQQKAHKTGTSGHKFRKDIYVPSNLKNFSIHRDGTVHVNRNGIGKWKFYFFESWDKGPAEENL